MRRLKIVIAIIFLFSCKSSIPKDILAPKKMQAVLWDVMQADEMAEYYSAKDTSFRSMAKHVGYYQKVFAIHKISKEDFTRSLTYYESHPKDLKIILDSLQSFGERLQKADSLKKPSYNPIGNDTTKRKPKVMVQS